MYLLTPVIAVETESTFRPYMQGAILNGDSKIKVEEAENFGERFECFCGDLCGTGRRITEQSRNLDMEKPACEFKTFESLLEEDGFIVYTNVGCSMLPLLRQRRDIIEIRPIKSHPKKYDVVLYKRNDRYILHRIIKVLPDGYVIAGDHNTFKEYDVTDDMILGVMTRVIRDGKTITPDQPGYKFYYHLWVDFYPVRVLILKGKGKARGLARRLKK